MGIIAGHAILIAGGDNDFRENLSDILRGEGYAPVTAATGKDALEKARDHECSVALIDLRLRDMSGFDVLQGIKERAPATEVILVTGSASQSAAIDAMNLDAYRYVEKPLETGKLLGMIRRAIEKWEMAKALHESQERYRTLFEESRDAILITSPHNRFIEFNQASLDLLGYAREELTQRRPSDLFVEIADFRQIEREIHDKGYIKEYEVEFRHREGKGVNCLISSTRRLIDSCNVLEYQTIVKDITRQKKIQQQLERTLSLLRKNLNGVIRLVTHLVEKRTPIRRDISAA